MILKEDMNLFIDYVNKEPIMKNIRTIRTITKNVFPKQSKELGKYVNVCFDHDVTNNVFGTIIRDDIEEPYKTIIYLDDRRYVLGTECQYHIC